jgi:hypothetical protein
MLCDARFVRSSEHETAQNSAKTSFALTVQLPHTQH